MWPLTPTFPLHKLQYSGIPANADKHCLGSRHKFKHLTIYILTNYHTALAGWYYYYHPSFHRLGDRHRVADKLPQGHTAKPRFKQRLCDWESVYQSRPQLIALFTQEGWRPTFLLMHLTQHRCLAYKLHGREWFATSTGHWPAILGSPRKLFTFIIVSFICNQFFFISCWESKILHWRKQSF